MSTTDNFQELLTLEKIEEDHYRGVNAAVPMPRVFGGQVLAQSLQAAINTVSPERHVHSFHSYFLRGGVTTLPILFEVDRIRDGRSFTTRRVVAIQKGEAIFSMSVSFQKEEEGLSHQIEMPNVPDPDELPSDNEVRQQHVEDFPALKFMLMMKWPMETKNTGSLNEIEPQKLPPEQHVWMRFTDPLPDGINAHKTALAFASDLGFMGTSLRPHGVSFMQGKLQGASLDHAMWFHRSFRADEWLLYSMDSPSSSGARGFNRGNIFNREGELVASTAQEGLIRLTK